MNVCPECNKELLSDLSCGGCGFIAQSVDGFVAFSAELASGNDSYDADFHEKLFQLENNCFWFSERNRLLVWAMKKYFPDTESFLEIGCGTGFVLKGLADAFEKIEYTGADIYTTGLKFAAEKLPQARFIQMDARFIPFHDEFDVLGAFDIIEHVEEDQQILDQMFKAVRAGGGIVVTVPQHKWLWSTTDIYGCHKRRYTRAELRKKITESGFTIIRIISFMSLLLPLILLLRGRYLFLSKEITQKLVRTELNINPVLDFLFKTICALERRLIETGISFPAGGSLLCIAKKGRI